MRLTISPRVRCWRAEAERRSDLRNTPVVIAVRSCHPARVQCMKYAFSVTALSAISDPKATASPMPDAGVSGRMPNGREPSMKEMQPASSGGYVN